MEKEKKLNLIKEVPFWWHTIDFEDGVITPGQTPQFAQDIRLSSIPQNIWGKSVLDIGCWDGFFAFECEKRGADVTAIDNLQQEDFVKSKYNIDFSGNKGFETAKQILNSKVSYLCKDFYEIKDTLFDIVLFFGILYHTKHPLLALEHLFTITNELLILESHYIPDDNGNSYMKFYAKDEENQDPTNWWGPTTTCIQKMSEVAGFSKIECLKNYYDNDNRVIFHCYK